MKRRLTEKEIERVQIEQVFGLTGGELEKEPLVAAEAYADDGHPRHIGQLDDFEDGYTFAYWYTGVPEYAAREDFGLTCADDSDFITVIDTSCVYGVAPLVLVDPDGTVWVRVGSYTSSGETSCCYEDGSKVKVTREDAQLTSKVQASTPGPRVYQADRPYRRRARCPFCEADLGEEHGYIYIGDCAEVVYARMAKPHVVERYTEHADKPAWPYAHVTCTVPGSKDEAGDFNYRTRFFKSERVDFGHPLIVPELNAASVKCWLWSFAKAHPDWKLEPERIEIEEGQGSWLFSRRELDEDGEELFIPLFDLSEA